MEAGTDIRRTDDPDSASYPAALLEELREADEIRGAAVMDADGQALAVIGPEQFGRLARQFMDLAAWAGDSPITHAHVATDQGEVFAVRGAALALVATAPRFQLASLVLSDMRSVVRQLEGAEPRRSRVLSAKTPGVAER